MAVAASSRAAMGWWLLGAALAASTVRQPTFAPAPNVFDAEWLIASSGICSDFTVGARASNLTFTPRRP